jgi:branched-chain amino acid transport system permease protein
MGACIAGFMLGFIEIMTIPAIHIINGLFSLNIGSNLRDLIAYSIVLVILIFRPHGLFGQAYSAKLRI